jgi:DNA-binding NarL/FixJ family response regulator
VGEKVRVVVADDQPMIRESIRAVLEGDEGIQVVGEAADGALALDEVRRLTPDVALVDLRMPNVDGLSALDKIRAECPDCRVLVLSILSERECVREAFNGGAAGYAIKGRGSTRLADIVRSVAEGHRYVHPDVRGYLLEQLRLAKTDRLDETQIGLLELVSDGQSDETIAGILGTTSAEIEGRIAVLFEALVFTEPVQRIAAELRPELVG